MQYSRSLGRRQQRRLAGMLEESPWKTVLMKFAHGLPLPLAFCRLVDSHPGWSVSNLIFFSSQRDARALRPSGLVCSSGLHPTSEIAVGRREACVPNFSPLEKKRVLKIHSPPSLASCPQSIALPPPHYQAHSWQQCRFHGDNEWQEAVIKKGC